MISRINVKNKMVYYNEILAPEEFNHLYLAEQPLQEFNSRIITKSSQPFITFSSEDRKCLNTKENDLIIIRICKGNKEFQIVSKIYKWGKINIPRKIVDLLEIKSNEMVRFYIIAIDTKLDLNQRYQAIDLYELRKNKIKIIPRGLGYITIYSKQKIPITLPRFICKTSNLLELMYLVHGDGHYKYKLYFVNKSPELHEFVLNQFGNIFKIPKSLWKARILIHDLNFADYAKDYWIKILGLNSNRFYNYSKSKLNTDNRGNLRIILDNTIISLVFRFIFDKLKFDKVGSIHALNGLLCAEGGAQISRVGLHKITLSFNKMEREMFSGILDTLGLEYKTEQDRTFVISGWNRLYRFFKVFLLNEVYPFRIHVRRRENAIGGFLKHMSTITMKKYLSVIRQKDELTIKEISNLLRIRKDSVIRTIRKARYSAFLKINGAGINDNPYKASMTEEGKCLLDIINWLEEYKDVKKLVEIEENILVKKEATTSREFGCYSENRSVAELINYGIVVINKPAGPTSHQIADYAKHILKIDKAGHSGTLE